jgi:hypothetical protein
MLCCLPIKGMFHPSNNGWLWAMVSSKVCNIIWIRHKACKLVYLFIFTYLFMVILISTPVLWSFISPIRITLDIQGLQSDRPLSTLGLSLANSAPLASRRKVANHSPRTPRGNKPQARISGVGIFHSSNTFKYLHRGHFRYPCTKTTWTLAI